MPATYTVGVRLGLTSRGYTTRLLGASRATSRFGSTVQRTAGVGSRALGGLVRQTAGLGSAMQRSAGVAGTALRGISRATRRAATDAGTAIRQWRRRAGAGGGLGMGRIAGIAGGGLLAGTAVSRIAQTQARVVQLGIQARRPTDEMMRLYQDIEAVALRPELKADPSQILAAIEAIVEKTGDLDFAREHMELFAQAIQATGGNTGDAIGRLTVEMRKLEVTDVPQALELLTAQGKQGSFTLANMAAQGERLFSAFARLEGIRGIEGIRQLGAFAQVAKDAAGGTENAVTALEAVSRALTDADVIEKINAVGVRVRTGRTLRPLDRIFSDLLAATEATRSSSLKSSTRKPCASSRAWHSSKAKRNCARRSRSSLRRAR